MNITNILSKTAHRTWDLPVESWKYYQEWNNALFMHWEVPIEILAECVPEDMQIDTFEGKAYISLVAFTMEKIRPKNLPSISYISDFHEINVRTYIDNNNKKGVYFINIEAEKRLSAFISKTLSGLPYEKSSIVRSNKTYVSRNVKKNFSLNAEFEVKEILEDKTALDKWLTERYCCFYVDSSKEMYCYELHHHEWEIKHVEIQKLELQYKIGEIDLSGQKPYLVHYSEGVKVLAWGKRKA